MAFTIAKLALLGGANGFNLWFYRSTDALSTIIAAGYFTGDALNMLGPRDLITIEADGSGGQYLVENSGFEISLTKVDMDYVFDSAKIYLPCLINQVPLLAGTSRFVITPLAGYVTRMTTVVRSAVTTGGTLTVEIGGSAIEGLSNVIADADAAGTVVTDVPTNMFHDAAVVGNYVAARGAIELVGDSNFATAGDAVTIIEVSPDAPAAQNVYLTGFINQTDLLAGTSQFVVSPVAGQVARLTTISCDDVTTGGDITVEIGGTAVTGLTVTVGNAGGVGDIDTDTPAVEASSTGTVAAGGAIEIIPAAAFATQGNLWFCLEINPAVDTGTQVYIEDYIEQTDLLAGTSHWVMAPCTGQISAVYTASTVDITTGGTITLELGGTAVSGLSVVVGDAGGVGDADSDTPTDTTDVTCAVTKGDAIEIIPSAAFATAGTLRVLVEITPA